MNTVKLEHDSHSESYSTSSQNEEHITCTQNDEVSALFVEEVRHDFILWVSFWPDTLTALFLAFCHSVCANAVIVHLDRPWLFPWRFFPFHHQQSFSHSTLCNPCSWESVIKQTKRQSFTVKILLRPYSSAPGTVLWNNNFQPLSEGAECSQVVGQYLHY